jgi:hypothetical protein
MFRSTSRSIARCLLAVCVVATIGASHAAYAEASPNAIEDARTRFQRGVEFFKDGDYRAALIEFKRAYEVAPNYKILYNLGQTSLELQDYAVALRSFERYLSEGGKEVPAARKHQIEGEIEKLKKRVARIEVKANMPDVEVFVDDVSVGKTPLPPIVVSAGRRKIAVSKNGLSAVRTIDVAGGDSTSVAFDLSEAPAAPLATSTTPSSTTTPKLLVPIAPPLSPPQPAPHSSSKLWIGVTTTGVLAAATVVTGVLALHAKSQFDDKLNQFPVSQSDVDDARTHTRTLALTTDILGGAAIVAAGITATIAIVGNHKKNGHSDDQSIRIVVSPTGAGILGKF